MNNATVKSLKSSKEYYIEQARKGVDKGDYSEVMKNLSHYKIINRQLKNG